MADDDELEAANVRRRERSGTRPASGMQAARAAVREAVRAEGEDASCAHTFSPHLQADRDEGENFEEREDGKRRRRFRNRLEDEDDVTSSYTLEQDERRGGRLPNEEERQRFRNELFHDVVPARDDGTVGPPPPRPLAPIAWARAQEARDDPLALVPTREQRAHFVEEYTQAHNLLRSRTVSPVPRPFKSLDEFISAMKKRGAMLETQERIVSERDDEGGTAQNKRTLHRIMFQLTPEAFVGTVVSLAEDGAARLDEFFYWPAQSLTNAQ